MNAAPSVDPVLVAATRCHQAGDFAGAELRYRSALARDPENAGAWFSHAAALGERDECLEAALVCARRAVALAPRDGQARSNLGNLLFRMNRYREAGDELALALSFAPESFAIRHNLGLAWYCLGDNRRAEAMFTEALLAAPPEMQPGIGIDMAYPVLASGDLPRGWAWYENRWVNLRRTQVWDLGIPEWRGQDLAGKRVIVHHDQGFGDTLQFGRYMRDLRTRGARVTAAVPRPLIRLFEHSGLAHAACDWEAPLPEADFHAPVCSLPRHLGVTCDTIAGTPYLRANRDDATPLPSAPRWTYRIGLVWHARPDHATAAERSIPLHRFLGLALLPGVRLYSLQFGPRQADIGAIGADALITDLAPAIRDFADSAAMMRQLDLVVSVDTSALHLAGGLGVPAIGLLQSPQCWRWLRDRSDTPWYRGMRLLRQEHPGNWDAVLAELHRLIATRAR